MSGRWFDSSRQIFWDNNNQDLSIPGILQTSTTQISSLTAVNISSLKGQVSSLGINCNAPVYRLDVNGNANVNDNLSFAGSPIPDLGTNYSALGLLGGNSYGYMYGAFNSLGDGIHLSYNHINCNLGTSANGDIRSYIPNVGGGTSQLDLGYGQIQFAVGNSNTVPRTKMFVNSNGLTIANPNSNFSWRTTATNNAIYTLAVSTFNIASSTFTMECYFNPSATPASYGTIMSLSTTPTNGHEFRIGQRVYTNGLGFYFPTGPSSDGNAFLSASNVLQTNVWCHLALVRSTNFAYLYSNGTAILSTNAVSHSHNEYKRLFLFSNPYADAAGQGYINSARIVIGQALYTGNFAPPTQQLTASTVGTSGPNVAASLTGTVAFLGAITSTLTDSGPSAIPLNISGSPTSLVFSPDTFTNPSTLFTCLGSNIGINCNTPAYRLDVNGTTRVFNDGEGLRLQGMRDSNSLFTTFQKATLTAYVGWFGFGLQGFNFSSIFGMQTDASTNIAFYPGGAASPSLFLASNNYVGINCNAPQFQLDVNGATNINGNLGLGGVVIPTLANGYKAIGLGGGNSYGYMYGAFQSLGDGIHLSYNYINCNLGNSNAFIGNSGIATSQIDIQPGGIGFSIGAVGAAPTSKMYLNATGLGIGTASPAYTLDITGQARILKDGEGLRLQGAQNSNPLYITFQKPLGSAYVGWFGNGLQGTNVSSIFGMQSGESTSIAFYAWGAPVSNPSLYLGYPSGSAGVYYAGIGCNAPRYNLDVLGNIHVSGQYFNDSDQRVKENIVNADTTICYSTMQGINLKYFKWNSNFQSSSIIRDRHQLGFIAQEVQQIFPNSVSITSSYGYDDFCSIESGQLNAMHYGATKKLMEIVEQQGSTIKGIQCQLQRI